MAVGRNQWYHFGVGAPPILEPILVGIGVFSGVRDFDPRPYGNLAEEVLAPSRGDKTRKGNQEVCWGGGPTKKTDPHIAI